MNKQPQLSLEFSSLELLRQLQNGCATAQQKQEDITKAFNQKHSKTYKGSSFYPSSSPITISKDTDEDLILFQVNRFFERWEPEAILALQGAAKAAKGLIGKTLLIKGIVQTSSEELVSSGIKGEYGSARYETKISEIDVKTRRALDSIEIFCPTATILTKFCFEWQQRPCFFELHSHKKPDFSFTD